MSPVSGRQDETAPVFAEQFDVSISSNEGKERDELA